MSAATTASRATPARRHPPVWLVLLVVPSVFALAALLYPMRQYHWDVLERAYLLEHPARYLQSWDGSPRSQFLSFAHVLELPLAWVVGWFVPGSSGLRTLWVFEALCSGGVLWLLGALVRFWRASGGLERGALRAAFLSQLVLAGAVSFWKLGAGGQEKMLALATQVLFLSCFWRALAAPAPVTAGRDARVAWCVAATLALAILAHLTGAVLVPFAALALLLVPPAWAGQRARVARAVAAGALGAAVLYYAVAWQTTGVRSPASFFEYLTFFHREAGNNFFEPTGAAARGHGQLARALGGLSAFFAGDRVPRVMVLAVLVAGSLWRLVSRRIPGSAAAPHSLLSVLQIHSLLLCTLWAAHFLFFEPQNVESWTLVATLLVLVAGVSLPSGPAAWAAALLPALLLVTNQRHYVANHQWPNVETYRRHMLEQSRPVDIVLLTGGLRDGMPLEGSLTMRYFLATLPERRIVSLFDVMGWTQPEFWDRPFTTPGALQAAIDAGQRVYSPIFLKPDLERAIASGLVRITWVPRSSSLLEITRIEAGTAP